MPSDKTPPDQRYAGLDDIHHFALKPSENIRMADELFRSLDFSAESSVTPQSRVLFIRQDTPPSKETLGRVVTFSGLHNPNKVDEILERDTKIVNRFDPMAKDAPVIYASSLKTNQAGESFYVNIVAWNKDCDGRFVGGPFHTETRRFAVQGNHGEAAGFQAIVFGEGRKNPETDGVIWDSVHTTHCATNDTDGVRIVARRDSNSGEWRKESEERFSHSSRS